jgi:hypothetical protein
VRDFTCISLNKRWKGEIHQRNSTIMPHTAEPLAARLFAGCGVQGGAAHTAAQVLRAWFSLAAAHGEQKPAEDVGGNSKRFEMLHGRVHHKTGRDIQPKLITPHRRAAVTQLRQRLLNGLIKPEMQRGLQVTATFRPATG